MTQTTVPVNLGGDGLPFSDNGESARDMGNMGHATYFMQLVKQVISACSAAVSAASAIGSTSTNTSSTTSLAIGTGSKTLTVDANKAIVPGMQLMIASTAGPTNYMAGTVTAYNATTGALTVNVTVTSGTGTLAAWTVSVTGIAAATGVVTSSRTANTILGTGDAGTFVNVTANSFTQTFGAAATLGSAWFCYYKNSGSGTVTLDPNGSEQINGATTLALTAGQAAMLFCDGTQFQAIVIPAAFPAASIGSSGYQKLPSGLIIQWGSTTTPGGSTFSSAISFPIAFPTACLTINGNAQDSTITSNFMAVFNSVGASTFKVGTGTATTVFWTAIGY